MPKGFKAGNNLQHKPINVAILHMTSPGYVPRELKLICLTNFSLFHTVYL